MAARTLVRVSACWLALCASACELLAGIDDRHVAETSDGGSGGESGATGTPSSSISGSGGGPGCVPGGCGAAVCSDGACSAITSIALGLSHSCVSLEDHTVHCWGSNEWYQLGVDDIIERAYPGKVPGLGDVASLSRGGNHTCALNLDGTVVCWGRNHRGQLGTGNTSTAALPGKPVTLPGPAKLLSRTPSEHSCVISEGELYCWGCNIDGQLGNGTPGSDPYDPWGCNGNAATDWTADAKPVIAGGGLPKPITEVATGCLYTCAVAAGDTYCWGHGGQELGIGVADGVMVVTPTQVDYSALNLDPAVTVEQLSAACTSTCARLSDDRITCWGNNTKGYLGNGTLVSTSVPESFVDVGDAQEIRAGGNIHCALEVGGLVACWGENEHGGVAGEEPCGDSCAIPEPKPAPGLDASLLETGWEHACALGRDGLVCWGHNDKGQLGIGTPFSTHEPTPVAWGGPTE